MPNTIIDERPPTNIEMAAFLREEHEKRLAAMDRWEKRGCCGMPEQYRYVVTYETSVYVPGVPFDQQPGPISVETVCKCHLMRGRCRLATNALIERWKFINGGNHEPIPIAASD